MSEKKFCPNCGAVAIGEGRKITCEPCDAVYTVTKDGAKVESLGRIEDHEQRIKVLEGTEQKSAVPADVDQDRDVDQDQDQVQDQDQDQEEDLW